MREDAAVLSAPVMDGKKDLDDQNNRRPVSLPVAIFASISKERKLAAKKRSAPSEKRTICALFSAAKVCCFLTPAAFALRTLPLSHPSRRINGLFLERLLNPPPPLSIFELFRCVPTFISISLISLSLSLSRPWLALSHLGSSKVAKLHHSTVVDEDIPALDVAVNNTLAVQVHEPLKNLLGVAGYSAIREGAKVD